MGPEILSQVLTSLPKVEDPNLLVGVESTDDAAVYKLNDDMALVQTLDFFTPIVDDPYTFGKIAAANSLSDVYAMGAEPKWAMNIVCFPNCLEPSVLEEILRGGADKCIEAGCLVVGGHTVQDDEPKFGLSASSIIHPDKIWVNDNLQTGDLLILTKPIGVGILNTALKGEAVDEEDSAYKDCVLSMETLNAFGYRAGLGLEINACTDVTGFGLLGHLYEMAQGSDKTVVVDSSRVPIIQGAYDFAAMGLVPEGAYANRAYVGEEVLFKVDDDTMVDILFDPQTSGGLIFSLPEEEGEKLLNKLDGSPLDYAVIGRVKDKEKYSIIVE